MSFSVEAQILQHRFAAIAREGAETFRRIARGAPVIEEARYAAAIFDADGKLVAQTQGEPSHSLATGRSLRALIDYFAYDLADDDTMLVADPFSGGTSADVVTVAQPVAVAGDIRYFALVRFGLVEFGGELPGPVQPAAREIWQEALRLTPVKIRRAGALQADLWRYLLANSRTPDLLAGDLDVALSVTRHMAARLGSFVAGAGVLAADAAVRAGRAYARARAERHLAAIALGQGAASLPTADGELSVRVTLTRRDDGRLVVDLADSGNQSSGSANLTAAATAAAVHAVLFGALFDQIDLNEGLFDAVDVITRPGSVVDAAAPAAVSLGWRLVAPLVARAVAEAAGQPDPAADAGPAVVLFETIGSRSRNLPVHLSPGFRPAAGLAGAEILSGERRLVSAEEAESRGDFRLLVRERSDDGGMRVRTEVLRGGLEAVAVPSASGQPSFTGATPRDRSAEGVLSLSAGATIDFVYPSRDGARS